MRIAHVIDVTCRDYAPTTLALAGDLIGATSDLSHHVLVIDGPCGDNDLRQALNVDSVQTVRAPANHSMLQRRALRQALDRSSYDVIHAWSPASGAAAISSARHVPCLITVTHAPAPGNISWFTRRRLRAGRVRVAVINESLQQSVTDARIAARDMRVVRPGVDAARIPHDQRRALRIGWGVADDATRVVMLLGDPPNRADAAVAGLCVGLAHETGRRLRLLMSPRARGLRSAKQMAARIGRADRLIVDSVADTPWIALAGCDAALMLGGGSGRGAGAAGGWGGLPALWAMAAGVPVIAESAAFLDGVPADDVAENLIIAAGVRATARRLCQWHDEPDSARSTVRRAQRTVAEQYSVQQWAASVKAEYDILVCHSPGSPATAATVPAAGT